MSSVIPKIERLSRSVLRILGCNPGPYTLQGTNTYLIGTGQRRILLDAGDSGYPEYIENLKTVLDKEQTDIGCIVLTHWHHDHVGGIGDIWRDVLGKQQISLFKFARRMNVEDDPGSGLKYTYVQDQHNFTTDGATLTAVYTPGHTDDHMGLFLEEEKAFFTGDCVLGEGTCVFEDLYDYMRSLDVILGYKPEVIYPAHGPIVPDPHTHVTGYVTHRLAREKQILAVLQSSGNPMNAEDIVRAVYQELPESLFGGATSNVKLHLGKLLRDGRVAKGKEEEKWRVVSCSKV